MPDYARLCNRPGARDSARPIASWHDSLSPGFVANSASPPADVTLRPEPDALHSSRPPAQAINLLLRPDPHLWDGRFANNAWLQELPRPLTKLTWDNPLLISPALGAPAWCAQW